VVDLALDVMIFQMIRDIQFPFVDVLFLSHVSDKRMIRSKMLL